MDRPLFISAPRRRPGRRDWGTPMPLLHQSIADITEKEFVAKVLKDINHRDTLFNLKGLEMEGALIRREVELRHYRKHLTGDIDILVRPAGQPEQTTAIQVKRFKVGRRAVRTGRPNGLGEFKKGVRQANALANIGFSQVYLWVFVLVDTREQNGGRYCFDGPDSLLRSRIEHAISPIDLDPMVGLMDFDWVQPIDRPPLELGTYGGHLRRLAQIAQQPPELTEWLRTLAD